MAGAACGASPAEPGSGGAAGEEGGLACLIPQDELMFILRPDAIPALSNPEFVSPADETATYVQGEDRVIALVLDGEPVAIPLKLIHWHENVNLDGDDQKVAISYCPLTGTTLAFDRAPIGGAELGVSGILFRNNLVLFDRSPSPSFFPQMMRSAQCGPLAGSAELPMVATWEMRWDAWLRLHPGSLVASGVTGFARPYHLRANEEYERIDNPDLQFSIPIDPRRPPKERVLGIPRGADGGIAFPFEELKRHERLAIGVLQDGAAGVVLWDRDGEAALPFFTRLDEMDLRFTVEPEGFVDDATGSVWRLDGLAVAGPLAGRRLTPMPKAYVAFWFAWADFHPETGLWSSER